MKFLVTKTSASGSAKPCEEAVKTKIPYYDQRGFKTPEEHDEKFNNNKWFDRGTEYNSRENNTCVVNEE